MKTVGMVMIAEWISVGRKHWVRLHKHIDANGCATSYGYQSNNSGGSLGPATNPAVTDETAIRVMQVRVDTGYFRDIAVQPMRRVV